MSTRHDNETRIRGYPSKPVPILTKIPELTGYGFWDYPTFLIGVGAGDGDVTTRPTPILVPVAMMKLLKFYSLLVNFFYNFYII